jgi:hypothetical protein
VIDPFAGEADEAASATAHELADLARAGYRVLHEPSMQVEFEIHHLVDRPGGLAAIIARDPAGSGFAETLSAGANGVGLVVGTRIADAPGRAHLQADASVRLEHGDDEQATFRGSERPNLTFQHESAQLIDGVIAIEDEPRRMLLRHGLVVLDTLRHVAETALYAADAPLLGLQCPAQLPPTNSFQESADVGGRRVDPARSASIAIRFRIALDRPRADVRLQIADRLARHCEDRGLGFWLGDTRPGYRTGNWFLVHPHNRKLARARYRRDADLHRAGNAADGCLPVTFVGPARPGTTHAILSFLGQYPQIGVLGCSMTPLDELAFLNVQLAVSGASRARLAAVNSEITELRATSDGLADVLPRIVAALAPGAGGEGTAVAPIGPPTRGHIERLIGRAGDYQVVVGPALPVVPDSDVRRIPIWISWQMRRSEAGLRAPLLALHRAVDRLGLAPPEAAGRRSGALSIEYLVCRRLGMSVLRGRGKMAVAKSLIEGRFRDFRNGPAQLSADLEGAWRAELRAAGHDDLVSNLSVSPREFLLGGQQ